MISKFEYDLINSLNECRECMRASHEPGANGVESFPGEIGYLSDAEIPFELADLLNFHSEEYKDLYDRAIFDPTKTAEFIKWQRDVLIKKIRASEEKISKTPAYVFSALIAGAIFGSVLGAG